MAMVINNNIAAMTILGETKKNSKAVDKGVEKLSSGMKINSAGDGASEYSISEKMRAQIRSLDQDNQNAQNAQSLLKVADGVLSNSVAIMRTMKEKAIDAANDTNTDADRAIIQKELNQHIDQLNDNALVTFNGKYIFDGAADHTYSKEQTIMAALNTEWIGNSLDMIARSTGLGFDKGNTSVNEMDVVFKEEGETGTLAYVTHSSLGGVTNKLTLTVNMTYYNDLVDGDVNGASTHSGAGYLDRTIAHEMTHAIMSASIEGFGGLYQCITEGAAEVIHGIDDLRRDTITSLAGNIANTLSTSPGTGDENQYAAGYVMFRYMAAQSGFTAEQALTHFMSSLADGTGAMTTARIDAAVSAATKGKFASFSAMQTQMAADEGTAGANFLKDYCDIDLYNDDTGAITGHDAGVSRKDKTKDSVVPEGGSVKYWTNPDNDHTYINGLKVNWPMEYMQIKGGLFFQTGTKAAQNIHAVFSNVDAQALGLQDKNGKNVSVQTQTDASNAIAQLDKSIERALDQLTKIGALHSRLDYTIANITTATENVTSAESVIRDSDMAKEMTDYTKNNVLLQAAQSMLSQANQSSSAVLSLLQ
ncbi:Flagellin protein FlaA [Anaerovibrio sp. JC8]|uniref:flagellinolysin n=1 Tax=Anaerovibrio sp. JC8 TaxID=1240085 RepID=UPI000A0D682E|nr:flagellinolysin [Anaerovibrio sp. JC8]ORU00517.1 Flagellin protein FlaA [Anaerovibrio sp. JC8]